MEEVVIKSRAAARGVLTAMCAICAIIVPILVGYRVGWVILLAVCVLPIAAIATLISSCVLFRNGTDTPSTFPMIGGCLFILGGVALDIAATVHFTPDLSQEQNVFARLLLDSGIGVKYVYMLGGFLQLVLVACMCILWGAFLRHRGVFISSSFSLGSSSFATFLKAATGGGELTWRQWFFPLNWTEMPSAYHLVWVTAPFVMAGAAYRWYLGLQWLEIGPYVNRILFVSATCFFAVSVYVGWLYSEYRTRIDSQ